MTERHQAFNELAGAYSRARPQYPEPLWRALSAMLEDCPVPAVAADIGSGTGISTRQLAAALPHWHIIGIEPGEGMRAQAVNDSRGTAIEFRDGAAEAMPLETASTGLVIAAQALHWFDHTRFYAEAQRVLAPGGFVGILQSNRVWQHSPIFDDYEAFLEEHSPGYSRDYRRFDVVTELADAGFTQVTRTAYEWSWPMTHELFIQVVRSTTKMQAAVDNLGEAEATQRLRALLGHHHPTGKFEVPYASELFSGHSRNG